MKIFLATACVLLLLVWDTCEELTFSLTNEESGSVSEFALLETNFTNDQRRADFTNAQSKMNFQSRIVGGEEADILDFPYIVSVQRRHYHLCGGSLLSTTLVMTAAHCCLDTSKLINNKFPIFDIGVISVLVGTRANFLKGLEDLPERGVKRGVIAIFAHKFFNGKTFANDIGVMKLSYPVRLSAKIKLTPRPWEVKMPEAGTVCTAVGWGFSTPQPPGQEKQGVVEPLLRKVDLSVLDVAKCQGVYKRYAVSHTICTYTPGKDTCAGDSGGPLLCNGVQVGITSFSDGCAAEGRPGAYQRVDIHLGWLKDTTARALNASSRYGSTSWSLHLYILNVLFCYVDVTKK